MSDLLVEWLAFPALLVILCTGCGLLVEWAAGRQLPGAVLPSLGLALIVVVASATTGWELGARVTPELILGLALAGFFIGRGRLRALRPDPWIIGVAAAIFLALLCTTVAVGESTWTGYYRLNDSVFHFSLVDWIFENGQAIPAGESAYHENVRKFLDAGYPVGAHLALGVGRELIGADVPWVLHPYLSVLLAFTALALYALLDRIGPPAMRALTALVATGAGLVCSYYVSGNIKEIGMLWAMVAAAAVVLSVRPALRPRTTIAPILVLLAGYAILSLAALAWLGLIAAVLVAAWIWQNRRAGVRRIAAPLAVVAGLLAVGVVLAFETIRTFVRNADAVLTDADDLGNLEKPLSWMQVTGIWPVSDFRFDLMDHEDTGVLLAWAMTVAAVLGLVYAVRRRLWGPLLLFGTATLAGAALLAAGSPYADGKTLMIISPVVVLAGMLGAVALHGAGLRIVGWLLAGVLAYGVLWTDAIVLFSPRPAPRDRYEELELVADRIPGNDLVYFAEWDEFMGYFARDANATGRPFLIPKRRSGLPPRIGEQGRFPYDLDELTPSYVQQWRTIVLPWSPTMSRPPSNYSPVAASRRYVIWQKDPEGAVEVLEHYSLGDPMDPGAKPRCEFVDHLGARASRLGDTLAFSEVPRLAILIPGALRQRPPDWLGAPGDPGTLVAASGGRIAGRIHIPESGRYSVGLQGQLDRTADITIGDSQLELEPELGPPGQFIRVGEFDLPRGNLPVRLALPEPSPFGPTLDARVGNLVFTPTQRSLGVQTIDPERAGDLCGRRLDWIELVRPGGT